MTKKDVCCQSTFPFLSILLIIWAQDGITLVTTAYIRANCMDLAFLVCVCSSTTTKHAKALLTIFFTKKWMSVHNKRHSALCLLDAEMYARFFSLFTSHYAASRKHLSSISALSRRRKNMMHNASISHYQTDFALNWTQTHKGKRLKRPTEPLFLLLRRRWWKVKRIYLGKCKTIRFTKKRRIHSYKNLCVLRTPPIYISCLLCKLANIIFYTSKKQKLYIRIMAHEQNATYLHTILINIMHYIYKSQHILIFCEVTSPPAIIQSGQKPLFYNSFQTKKRKNGIIIITQQIYFNTHTITVCEIFSSLHRASNSVYAIIITV